jgi:bacteriophage HK97-gp10 putative tail-component
MAKGFQIKTVGLEGIERILAQAPDAIIKEVGAIFEDAGKRFVQRAKRDAPKDTGFLAGQITSAKTGALRVVISSQSRYAGYLEFGTKSHFRSIPGFEAVAAELKGKGSGSFKDMVDNVTQWARRKGVHFAGTTPEQTGYLIARSIMRNGIEPRPYFFKQVPILEQQLDKDLQAVEKAFK